MMPRLDGFGLLRQLRADERTRTVPVILLSARAGEESRVEGLTAGADDYLVKPFSARELLAVVNAHVQMAHIRREVEALRLAAEKAEVVRESEQRFRTMANAIPQLAWIANADGYIYWYNKRWYEYTGTTPAQMEGWGWQSVHDPQELPKVLQRWKASIATGEPFDMIFPLRGGDCLFRPFLTRIMPLKDEQGRVQQWFGTNTDVTEQKRAEDTLRESQERLYASLHEKEVLLKEIHHRVKNNMQVISSLVDLQADRTQDEAMRAVLQDVMHRVRSMALVHEKLYQSPDMARVEFAEYAQSLLGYLWRAHGNTVSGVRLVLDLEPVPLPINAAVPCGLILNELATNALKHAFRGRADGEVTVSLRGGKEGQACLRVRDNGVGLPAALDWRKAGSLGLRLVQILAAQLHAAVEVNSDEGTEFIITFGGPRLQEQLQQ